ncbi:MAG: PIN domain-containing protein [Thermodesulfobacteriota bacterium]
MDTSVWIAFFRQREPCHRLVAGLIDEERVCCTGIILAELIQGAKSDKELSVLDSFLQVFEFLPESPRLWAQAGRLSGRLRQQGMAIGLADCFIATAALAANLPVATLDGHFRILHQTAGVELLPLEPAAE